MITIDTPAIPVTILDSICLGSSQYVNLTFAGSGFYNYTWTPGTSLSSSTGSIVTITPTTAGDVTYVITVSPGTNPLGCSVTDVVKLHTVPNTFTLLNDDTTICIGRSVSATVTGAPDFTWLWTPSAGVSSVTSTTPTMTPTVTTTYTVTATYGSHCSMSQHFTITVDTPAHPVTIADTICLGMIDNVNLTFPGSGFYHFSWSPTTYLSTGTLPVVAINPAVIGDYTYDITVYPGTNPPGCSVTDIVNLHVAPNDFTLANDDTAICLGKWIQAVVVGSSEFQYSWTPTAGVSVTNIPDPILTPTVTTTYTVTASYAPHCPDMMHHFSIEVDTLAHPITVTDTTCLTIPDTANLSFPNSNTYTFIWAPTAPALNTWVFDSTYSKAYVIPTGTGTYNWSIVVSPRALECSVTDEYNLLVTPNSFTISPTVDTVCIGTPIQVIGIPYPLFSYQWVPTSGIPISDIINPVITADTSATYVVSAYFPKCPIMRDTLTVNVQPYPTVFMGGDRAKCEYDTLHLSATVIPGWYNSYTYNWTPAGSLNATDVQNVVYIDTVSQKVVVTVTTPYGCVGADSAEITVYPGNFMGTIPDYDFCPGDSAKITPTGATSYQWRPVMYISDSLASTPTITPITSGVYTVVGTSINGCKDTVTFNVFVHPAALIYLPDSVTIYPGEDYAMPTQSNCVNFVWTPSYGLNNTGIINPVATPQMTIEYFVTASTEWNCVATDSITVNVDNHTLLALPNAFTPGNGVNNEFKIIKRGIATLNYFRIYNRWGELIFQTTDIDQGWDGSYKGAPQPFGVYVWEYEAVTSSGAIFTKAGNLTLIR